MQRKKVLIFFLALAVAALGWVGYRQWHKRKSAGSFRAALPVNPNPGITGARPPGQIPATAGPSSQPMSAGQLPNRSSTEDVQRTLRTIDEINRINKLNRDQSDTSKRK